MQVLKVLVRIEVTRVRNCTRNFEIGWQFENRRTISKLVHIQFQNIQIAQRNFEIAHIYKSRETHTCTLPHKCSMYACMQFYQKGVFRSTACSSSDLNHSMVVVGYGIYSGREYWLLKNR